ncbi:MAG TPA: ABC transporter substrate-binding protein [Candidatus Methylomirabilis sp.]|nr:ABC transporter substrate-binding protein [Candidatus Methylomirabilis sp.]
MRVLRWVLVLVMQIATAAPTWAASPLQVSVDTEAFRKVEAEAIADMLRAIGVEAEVRVWEASALRDKMLSGERAMYLTDWGSAYFDPFDLAEPKLTTGGRGNFAHYGNKEVDALLRGASTQADPKKRQEAYSRIQQLLLQDAPWIFGYHREEVEASSVDVENWEPAMDSRINLHRVGLKRGDVLVVAMNADSIPTLDPAMHRLRYAETVIRNIFDGLVTRTTRDTVVPEIAESWTQVNPTVWEFKLRQGVTFQNGDPLTAQDVVFTFDRVLREGAIGGKSSPRKGLLGPLAKVEAFGSDSVRFTLANPFPPFLQAIVHFQIVPKGYIAKVGDAAFAEHPVGAGPFRFVQGKLDSQIVLERYDRYYGGSPAIPPVGPARLKGAVFRMMPEPATRVAALKAGEVHIIQSVPLDLVPDLERDQRVSLKTAQGTRVYAVELNNAKAPFNDVRVRQAMNYAINWDQILKTIYRGYGSRLATAFLPSGFGFDPKVRPYPYDPAKARALLKQAGYAIKE